MADQCNGRRINVYLVLEKYNCKEDEISISFRADGSLKISIVPDEEFINSLNVKVNVF